MTAKSYFRSSAGAASAAWMAERKPPLLERFSTFVLNQGGKVFPLYFNVIYAPVT
jgi:hypothetical protein